MSVQNPSTDPDGLRPLMLRYLDDALSAEDLATLNDGLRTDPGLRREFAEVLYEHTDLSELCKEESRGFVESADRPHMWRMHVALATTNRVTWNRRLRRLNAVLLAAVVLMGFQVGWSLVLLARLQATVGRSSEIAQLFCS